VVEVTVGHHDRLVLGELEDADGREQGGREVPILDQWTQPVGTDQTLPVVGDAMAACRELRQRLRGKVGAQQRCDVHPGGVGVGRVELDLAPRRPDRVDRHVAVVHVVVVQPERARPIRRQDPDQVSESLEQRIEERMV
jgi:hypothetical protein